MKKILFRAVILGAPGSGKGTISSRILRSFEIKHLSSGDCLRNHIQKNTDLGKEAKTFIEKGQLVPDNIILGLITKELSRISEWNWLLDGFPRTQFQASELHKIQPINVALNLEVPFDVIISRIQERWIHPASGRVYNMSFAPPKVMGKDDVTGEDLIRRPDDQPDAVAKRLEVYSSMTKPLLDYYRDLGILQNFCGKTSDEIWPKVYNYLSCHLKPSKKLEVP